MKNKLKEFRLTRHTMAEEECFVEAKNWEDAEEMGYLDSELDWEFVYDHGEIEAEEIENDKA